MCCILLCCILLCCVSMYCILLCCISLSSVCLSVFRFVCLCACLSFYLFFGGFWGRSGHFFFQLLNGILKLPCKFRWRSGLGLSGEIVFKLLVSRACNGSPGLWVPAGTRGARIRKIMCASPAMQRFAAWRHPVALRHDVWDPIPNTPVCTRGAAAAAPRPQRRKFVSDAVREKL